MKMKRVYTPTLEITGEKQAIDNHIQGIARILPLSMGEVRSCAIPGGMPTATTDAYTEQEISNRASGELIMVVRESDLETLNKLTNPLQ